MPLAGGYRWPEAVRSAGGRIREEVAMPVPDADREVLAPSDIAAEGLDDWRLLDGFLCARFASGTFARGLTLVERLAAAAEEAQHHPDVDLRYAYVDVRLVSHDVDGVTRRDVRLARVISELAGRLGAPPESASL